MAPIPVPGDSLLVVPAVWAAEPLCVGSDVEGAIALVVLTHASDVGVAILRGGSIVVEHRQTPFDLESGTTFILLWSTESRQDLFFGGSVTGDHSECQLGRGNLGQSTPGDMSPVSSQELVL